MEFRILGPLEAWKGGAPVTLGGAKQRALLAILLLHANEVVSTESLIDLLWEEPPAKATKALRVAVAQGAGRADADEPTAWVSLGALPGAARPRPLSAIARGGEA